MEINCRKPSIQTGDGDIPAFFCIPPGKGRFPAVIVLHGSDGFKSNHAEFAQGLCREGFAVLVPTWFGGESPRAHWDEVRVADLVQTGAWLKSRSGVRTDLIGCLGFSRGGGLALIFGALLPETRAIVNYFGLTAWKGGLEEFAHLPLNENDPFNFVKKISCPIISFHGDQDNVVPVENTYRLDDACRRFGVDHHYFIYARVNHSFVWPGDKYNESAQLDSWQRALGFLQHHLVNS